jgi:hypothetical protein
VGVTVYPNLPTSVSIAASPTTIGSGPVTFTATSSNGGPNPKYTWYLNTLPAPGADTTATWTTSSLQDGDLVAVKMESRAICPAPAIVWSRVVPVRGGVVQVGNVPAGQEDISIYPNPTTGQLGIRSQQSGRLSFYDLQGGSVGSYEIKAGNTVFQLPETLAAGIYMGRFISSDGKLNKTFRIVYQH